jgi:hypothetical protein
VGTSLSYIGVKGKTKEQVWKELSLTKSNRLPAEFYPSRNDITGTVLRTGWYLILDGSCKLIENKPALTKLSQGAAVVIGAVEEHVNYSMAAGWGGGRCQWTVEHNRDQGEEDLQVTGSPPPVFVEIKKKIVDEREHTPATMRWDHYFSIPVDLFYSLVGFSYDRVEGGTDASPVDALIPGS